MVHLYPLSVLLSSFFILTTTTQGFAPQSNSFTAKQQWRLQMSTVEKTQSKEESIKSLPKNDEIDPSTFPLPPTLGQNFYRKMRDTLSYISNPERFIADRSERLGPVFLTYMFFEPTVICGGQESVKEFIRERENQSKVIHSALPDTFKDLHTKWGALNLDSTDVMFKEARRLFADTLSSSAALEGYTKTMEKDIDSYVENLVKRVEENPEDVIYLVPELKSMCLQTFSVMFTGEGLTKDQERMFDEYNDGLLALSKSTDQHKKGVAALNELKAEMIRRFRKFDNDVDGSNSEKAGKWFHDQISNREGFEDIDRIGSVIVLYIWGAYIECAALMISALAQLSTEGDDDKILMKEEVKDEFKNRLATGLDASNNYQFWSQMPYTTGVLRESLRLKPPGGGVSRSSDEDFVLSGYRIPAGTPIMLDPRIGNKDPNLYQDPENFQPSRWVPVTSDEQNQEASSSCPFRGTALKLGPGAWFPGGNGAHQCPGVPLAELISKILVTKMVNKFDSWQFSGDGLKKDKSIDFVEIPIKIPVDNFGMTFKV